MNRRGAGLADRHALLSTAAYPSSSRSASPSLGLGASRSASPFENPYGGGQGSSYVRAADPYDEYEVAKGAPKKEPRYSGGAALGGGIASRIAAYGSQRTAEDLEGQNDEKLEGLSAKVKMLKDVSICALES